MALYVKIENFIEQIIIQNPEKLKVSISQHKRWVKELSMKGVKICSGYMVDDNKKPGGGGLLILEVNSYEEALKIIKKDPMIKSELVNWRLQEWIPVFGKLDIDKQNHLG